MRPLLSRVLVRATMLVCVLAVPAAAAVIPAVAEAKRCSGANATPGSISSGKAAKAVACLLNKKRVKQGVGKLDRHKALRKPARKHTKLMVRTECFQHQCPGEASLGDRLSGYLSGGTGGFGENIAYGSGEFGRPKAIVKSWMRSEGHRRNILNPQFEHVGVGVVWGSPAGADEGSATYTTDFGYRSGR